MVDNQHRKISGYRDLSETEIEAINKIKELEVVLNNVLNGIQDSENGRHVAIARTHLETGFMFAIKAIAKPQ